MLQAEAPATPTRLKRAVVEQVQELPFNGAANRDKPALLIVHSEGEVGIVGVFADVLGQPWRSVETPGEVRMEPDPTTVLGIGAAAYGLGGRRQRWRRRIVINAHCVDAEGAAPPDEALTARCDYEYLYTRRPFFRRDLARFLSFILGQTDHHRDLSRKKRTTLISTTFPDVHAALPNLDILSVGADAIELRVDLLKEPLGDGTYSALPSLRYVGEQLMILRQRTELPIIYTTRCTNENGRFPMDDPGLFYRYLYRAIQWGVEYIDVEVWLPEEVRRSLAERKGSSRIISAFHDFSGTFKWTAPEAQALFEKGAQYGDVVKMIALVNSNDANYELEYFRSIIQAKYPSPPFSGLNMGLQGQLSRLLNKIFTPITHPLLPMIAAPGQLSAAQINTALHSMGQMPKLDIYGVGSYRSTTQAMFFEKCFNELSLPHQFIFVEKGPKGSVENLIRRHEFGGAYVNPPVAVASAPYLPCLSDAARAIGQVDTVLAQRAGGGGEAGAHNAVVAAANAPTAATFVGDNASWKGIRATLLRDFVPTAYGGRAAFVLANAEADAAAAIFALKSLGIGPIYAIGFRGQGYLAGEVEPVRSVEDVKRLEQPFVIISALPAEKSPLVGPLLKHYSGDGNGNGNGNGNGAAGGRRSGTATPTATAQPEAPGTPAGNKVFVDLSNGPRKSDPLVTATALGWKAYGIADVSAWTTVETLRLLVGQNVPYDFVRLASGRGLF
ncbi:type I 3-dehydroquinase-domain-containing protein [Lineolata rhizophorae]|uniref:Type I 3-dehydroquinase-domain-containing protein n=1 Tax=Lineolata rhizophorae TaxID=578093 RepID=A0A6A6PCY0_9PEZI|nr:type I 3-dehydroquinase-domain-containing protein [Lineolata rhizophorae]